MKNEEERRNVVEVKLHIGKEYFINVHEVLLFYYYYWWLVFLYKRIAEEKDKYKTTVFKEKIKTENWLIGD